MERRDSGAIRIGTRPAAEEEVEAMIVLEDAARCGHGIARSQDQEPQMMTDDELKILPRAWAPCGGDCTVACADWLCADEQWSYDLFDLQDTGLVPMY